MSEWVTGITTGAQMAQSFNELKANHSLPLEAEVLIASENIANIYPAGLGDANKINVSYGDAVGVVGDLITMTSNGVFNFRDVGTYWISFYFQFGRENSNGTAHIVLRSIVNGVQQGTVLSEKLSNSDDEKGIELHIPFPVLTANTELYGEIMRDTNGTNDGGLIPYTPAETVGGWNTKPAPSASIVIYRIRAQD